MRGVPVRCPAAALLVVIAGCGANRHLPDGAARVPEPFRGTVRITLTQERLGQKVEVRVSDPDMVREFLAAIQLVPKNRCKCDHFQAAVFEKQDGSVSVSLCDHCFDFSGRHYKMPAEFYQLFQREIGKAVAAPVPSKK
ncbi:MAG: hypothetical protein FJ290_17580 [Planctomycetes bacterium]|nr:hypothetical protein [Planctomycetota bacterium]